MLLTTTQTPGPGIEYETIGMVVGNVIRAKHIGTDIIASLRNIIGGEVKEYTKLMAEAREQAKDRMIAQAREVGADAVIEIRFTTAMVMTGASELLAYGTAVRFTNKDQA
ncbi:MAG: YbjQ family protein [Hyphomicrobiaceae bacterium]|nr:YbjQ family protein [Hyphomicrobiaceae bacterium]